MKLRFRALIVFIIYCVSVGHTKRRKRVEVEKPGVTMKFPINTFEIPVQTQKGNIGSSKRDVESRDEDCRSLHFVKEFKKLRQQVKCIPRDTAVELGDNDTIVIPNTVIVKRCGGACNEYTRCVPTARKYVTFYVKKKKNDKIYCTTITVPEDTKCSCGNKPSCSSSHIYNRELHKCVCKRRQCQPNFTWDKEKCSCVCKRGCTTGTLIDLDKCRCVKEDDT